MTERIIEFVRKKDLQYVRELGQGACGKTVLLYDPLIEEYFVCKKFQPYYEPLQKELFSNFVREIKFLHKLNHRNVVRVFNYYLYPEHLSGYILMEQVQGLDIEEHLKKNPEQAGQIFKQAIEGFAHLEEHGILHRDLRPLNVLVSDTGAVKIIDFGFGKKAVSSRDFDKSITLNWWCEPPDEFDDHIYDFKTEVYFVGRLFEKIIRENEIDQFPFMSILGRMCKKNPAERAQSFLGVRSEVLAGGIQSVPFSYEELKAYRNFADDLSNIISKIEHGAKYLADPDEIEMKLEDAYRAVMLEERVTRSATIIECFVNGAFYFSTRNSMSVENLKNFIWLIQSCSKEKKDIVISNILTRLATVKRYHEETVFDDDIPF